MITKGRKRGVNLTNKGFRKLNQAKSDVEIENNFQRYTLETMSEKTGLTPYTLSKVFSGSSAVDKQTLKCCFDAFNLTLLKEDYVFVKPKGDNLAEISSRLPAETCSDVDKTGDHEVVLCDQASPAALGDRPNTPGDQIPLDSVFYVDRPIIESLCYEAIQQLGVSINICAPKQMGKTSLMTRILAYAQTQGYQTVSLNLQLPDAEILQNLERLLKWFCGRVSKQLGLSNTVKDFWDNSLGSKTNATDYFNDVLLPKIDRPLVLAIDELNELFAHPDIAREFLLLLRIWTEKAKARIINDNLWYKLRLITVHSTEIPLPKSINFSFFNTGLIIKLPEFTVFQVQDLATGYEQNITKEQIEQLIALLRGHL